MLISSATAAGPGAGRRLVVRDAETSDKLALALSPAAPSDGAGAGDKPLERIGITDFAAAGAKAKGVDAGVSLLIQGVNEASPSQVANVLRQYNLVHSPELAQSEGQRLVDLVQNKGAGALLIGLRAGVATFVVIDTLAPKWSFGRKAAIGLVVAAIVAALVFFGIRDEPPRAPAAAPTAAP